MKKIYLLTILSTAFMFNYSFAKEIKHKEEFKQILDECKNKISSKEEIRICLKKNRLEKKQKRKENRLAHLEKKQEKIEQKIEKHKKFDEAKQKCKKTSKSKDEMKLCIENTRFNKKK